MLLESFHSVACIPEIIYTVIREVAIWERSILLKWVYYNNIFGCKLMVVFIKENCKRFETIIDEMSFLYELWCLFRYQLWYDKSIMTVEITVSRSNNIYFSFFVKGRVHYLHCAYLWYTPTNATELPVIN